jgi:hypothetical protein
MNVGTIIMFVAVIAVLFVAYRLLSKILNASISDLLQILVFNLPIGYILTVVALLVGLSGAYWVASTYVPRLPVVQDTLAIVNEVIGIAGLQINIPGSPPTGQTTVTSTNIPGSGAADLSAPAPVAPATRTMAEMVPPDFDDRVNCWRESTWQLMRNATGGGESWVPSGVQFTFRHEGVGWGGGAPRYFVNIASFSTGEFTISRGLGEELRKIHPQGGSLVGNGPWPTWADCRLLATQKGVDLNAPVGGGTTVVVVPPPVVVVPQTTELISFADLGGPARIDGLTLKGDSLTLYPLGNPATASRTLTSAVLSSASACGWWDNFLVTCKGNLPGAEMFQWQQIVLPDDLPTVPAR